MALLITGSFVGAQTQTGTITGAVRDSQGAVLPGVVVTIESPALIGTRTSVTGPNGVYRFANVPTGVYSLTFELVGFQRLSRQGIRVPVATTITVDIALQLSGVEETVTVTGESPVVDVKQTVQATNIEKELFEAIPTGRNPWVMAGLVPGMVTGRLDVGGNNGMQQYGMEVFGSTTSQTTFAVDGLKVNWPGGSGGFTMQYYDFGMYEEYNFQTSTQSAESDVAGVYMNMVTKSGGNDFAGDAVFYFENDDLQSDNVDAALESEGANAGNPIEEMTDFNATLGGPIVQDKAWFFGSLRWWRLNQVQLGAVNPDGSNALDDNRIRNFMGKGTWQASADDKIAVMWQRNLKDRFHRRNPPWLFVADEFTFIQDLSQIRHESIITSAPTWSVSTTTIHSSIGGKSVDFNVWDIDSAPEDSKKALEAAKKKFGFVPNLLGVLAEAPAALDAYMAVSSAFERTTLTPTEQQAVLLAASVENRCHYCVAAHSMVAKMLGASDETVRSLREDGELTDPRLRALGRFTRRVVATRGFVTDEDARAFLDAGFDKSQLLEVLVGVTQKTLSNYTNHIAHTPLDAAFEAGAWTAREKSEVGT